MKPNATIPSVSAKRRGKVWPRIYQRRYATGLAGYVVDLGQQADGKRARRVFPTKGEAESFADQKRIERANEGAAAFAVSWEVRREAASCTAKLLPYQSSLTEATEYFIEHVLKFRTAPVVEVMVCQMLDEARRAGCRAVTLHTLGVFFGRIVEQFGNRQLSSLTLEELNALCLVPELQPRTCLNRIRMVAQLYNFALKHGWVKENLARRVTVPLQQERVPGFLAVEEAECLLQHAVDFNLLPYVAIGLFAGVRRTELQQLLWTAVNLADREITIGPEIAKTRSRRVIPFDETLAAWLQNCIRTSGPIVAAARFETDLAGLRRAAGLDRWPHNALRHTFATYHVAQFHDPVRTAYLLGHRDGTDMLDSHYRGLVSSVKAKQFWALRPTAVLERSALRVAA